MFGVDRDGSQRVFYGGSDVSAFDGVGEQVRVLFASGELNLDLPPELEKINSPSLRFCGEVIYSLLRPITRAKLLDEREFFTYFRFMVGLGLNQDELAAHLNASAKTVSRYANGEHCPSDVSKQRGILIETHNFLTEKFHRFELYIQKSHRSD